MLVDEALRGAGLLPILEERLAGRAPEVDDHRLTGGDLLAVGALADRIRIQAVGDVVSITSSAQTQAGVVDVHLRELPEATRALAFLRDVAIARITSDARIRIHFAECGAELAPIALGFGASEIVFKSLMGRQELVTALERAGRRVEVL